MSKIDLHFHSIHSDGKLSVQELAKIIREKKLEYCALADHNTVEGIRELKACLHGSDTKVIPATEITTKYHDNEVHILAYDFDIDAAAKIVQERNDIVRRKKIEEMKASIDLSRKEGLIISSELVPMEKLPVTLTIALDICASETNQKLFQKKYGKRLIPEDVYYEYQAPGKSCAVDRSGVTIEWVVEKFKDVAKDLIIAHPFVSVSVVTKPLDEARIMDLLRMGITGVEVYHNDTSQEQIKILKRIVREHSLHFTGGSDNHGKKTNTPIGQYSDNTDVPEFLLSEYNFLLSEYDV